MQDRHARKGRAQHGAVAIAKNAGGLQQSEKKRREALHPRPPPLPPTPHPRGVRRLRWMRGETGGT